MKFDEVYAKLGNIPCMEEASCRVLYDWIVSSRPEECLELGFYHGKSSCVIGAALHENGMGKLMTIDMESSRKCSDFPNIIGNLDKTGLTTIVTPVFSRVSYTWELKKLIEQQIVNNICAPRFDFVFLDGAHFWETDVCAFFLAMKLLKPGGWFLFDDYMWSIETSDWWHKAPELKNMPDDYRKESQVERLVTLIVAQHPDIEEVVVRDNWAWARKKVGAVTAAGPRVTQLTKTVVKRWLIDKICGR